MAKDEVGAALRAMATGDADWRGGKTFSLVYHAGDEVTELLKDVYSMFLATNALSPMAFPSLRKMESEVLELTAQLLSGKEAAGSMTSGGTESILMAVKTAREWAKARRPEITAPEMVLPQSAHPAFEKAAHYLGVRSIRVPVAADLRADVVATEKAITENTILIVGSAPGYPHGVIDPIGELAAIAERKNIPCHVDACLGGFLLPFFERLGRPVPPWDFRVPGVTSISADLHKYGFAARGASTILYRDRALRKYQFFAYPDWPGGLYGSPTMTGSRPGGAIAAAWAVMRYLGEEGYLRLARSVVDTTEKLITGINEMADLYVLGNPDMSVFAFAAHTVDVYVLADVLEQTGWRPERQQLPPSLHLMVTPAHARIVEPFLDDLASAVDRAKGTGPAPEGSAAMYGMLGSLPDRSAVGSFIGEFLDSLG